MVRAKGRATLVTLTVLLSCGTFALAHIDSPVSDARKAQENEDHAGSLINIPSGREGIILFLGREIKPGENVRDSDQLTIELDGKSVKYRRLRVGNTIEKGEVIGCLEDGLARAEVRIKEARLRAAEADKMASEKTSDEASKRWRTGGGLQAEKVSAMSLEQLRDRELTYYRYLLEAKSKQEAVNVAKEELNQAKTILDSFQIRSGVRGIVRRIHKHPGEAVRNLETVVTLQLLPDDE